MASLTKVLIPCTYGCFVIATLHCWGINHISHFPKHILWKYLILLSIATLTPNTFPIWHPWFYPLLSAQICLVTWIICMCRETIWRIDFLDALPQLLTISLEDYIEENLISPWQFYEMLKNNSTLLKWPMICIKRSAT